MAATLRSIAGSDFGGDAANTADNVVGKRLTPADVDGVQRALPVLGRNSR